MSQKNKILASDMEIWSVNVWQSNETTTSSCIHFWHVCKTRHRYSMATVRTLKIAALNRVKYVTQQLPPLALSYQSFLLNLNVWNISKFLGKNHKNECILFWFMFLSAKLTKCRNHDNNVCQCATCNVICRMCGMIEIISG